MRDRQDVKRFWRWRVDQSEWKSVQREFPPPTTDLSAYVWMLEQKADNPLYLRSKPLAKTRNL